MRRGGMISGGKFPQSAFNLHNQAPVRANYQGLARSGFTVELLSERARIRLDEALGRGVILIRESAGEAQVSSTDTIKQRMRKFIDGKFTGSEMHGNNHRRVANASAQSVYFNVHRGEPALTSLIYSKFGVGKGDTFVDYLMLHLRGGTLRPKTGKYMMIPNTEVVGDNFKGMNVGSFGGFDVAMAQSKDREKLFLIKRPKGGKGHGVLLATLVKSLRVKPALGGLNAILAGRDAEFLSDYDAVFSRKKLEGRFV
jgi:hypothetical protein